METVSRVHDLASLKFRNGNLGWLGNSKDRGRFRKSRGTEIEVNLRGFWTRVNKISQKGFRAMEEAWLLEDVIVRGFQEVRIMWSDSQALGFVSVGIKLFWEMSRSLVWIRTWVVRKGCQMRPTTAIYA